ncbi:uncharacterized protein LOC117283911 [Fukomys damarensis]|uniref:uncharacterized protein LOC117283911 n=1 Tax=Fukomys damarensis TaxID=885580 RepID=UPI0014551606|nr:uncharacterized protein LOC117283911 [Fukomys damarensis]
MAAHVLIRPRVRKPCLAASNWGSPRPHPDAVGRAAVLSGRQHLQKWELGSADVLSSAQGLGFPTSDTSFEDYKAREVTVKGRGCTGATTAPEAAAVVGVGSISASSQQGGGPEEQGGHRKDTAGRKEWPGGSRPGRQQAGRQPGPQDPGMSFGPPGRCCVQLSDSGIQGGAPVAAMAPELGALQGGRAWTWRLPSVGTCMERESGIPGN